MSDDTNSVNDGRSLVQRETRKGDVISPHRAVLTLSKSMFNAGCFSLPYAWKLGGLWVSFALSFVIAGFNWYGNHILVKSSQHLAKKSERSSLDYGHFAKKVCDYSDIRFLRNNSKAVMYVINVTILFYQLGMCSVAILFIADNMEHLLGAYIGGGTKMMALIAIGFILITNMFTEMRVVSAFAMISSIFFLMGAVVIMQYAIRQPNKWAELPAATNFTGTIMFYGISMYSFEGQTMILPVENKLETPDDFLNNCGVLPTTMILCAVFMVAIGFYGYTAFGEETAAAVTMNVPKEGYYYFILPVENKLETPDDFLNNCGVLPTTMILCAVFMVAIGFYGYTAFGEETAAAVTMNVPKEGLYSTINVFLMLQSMLGHSIAMYVILDMFFNGFRRKFSYRFPNCPKVVVDKGFRIFWVMVTFLMAVSIPHLEIMIPLVGVTS
uniref:Aa_trans domain-containing protein n=1 Tax=Ascaris lumbricoides TaxID=6252 RepID=A0A0M3IHB3_ASCLU